MPSTYTSLHYHLVFATKDRLPIIAETWRARLHDYLGGTVRGLGGTPLGIGGMADHVHLLVGLTASHCLADFMRDLKKDATKWVQAVVPLREFSWQEGYAAFTVSPTGLEAVRSYVSQQEEHHRRRTFHDELVEMLVKSGITFDEKYLD